MVSLPPLGMASRALAARFMTSCSTCTGSSFTLPRSGSIWMASSTSSPTTRASIFDTSRSTLFRSSTCSFCLFSPKGQQLAGQVGCAAGRAQDLQHIAMQTVSGADCVLHQFGIAADHHEQVIEIVRNAARQQADCVHFLRLEKGGLQPPPLADVPVIGDVM